ncbi:MAG: flagellar export chaperone FlgN [Fimbriimonadaceae bacterium]|nr:flagellar export chaperone FlgN [Fimbriimonadaceae bacterium]QYK55893.1 MAG: flagellar export chaperone FlgN [Fimbriimonadaceae bacterium]
MTTTTKKTKALEALWWDWLSTSERLLRSLHEQTAALTLRDPDRVARIQPELDAMMALMEDIDARALACAKELAEELGREPNLRSLVQGLDRAEGMSLQAVANRVIVVARNVQDVVAKNRALIENEIEYFNGTTALIAKAAAEQQGPYGPPEPVTNVVMNQAA